MGQRQNDVLLGIQNDVTAFIVDDLRLDVGTGRVGRGVHVSQEGHTGTLFIAGCGFERGVNHTAFTDVSIDNAHALQLLH